MRASNKSEAFQLAQRLNSDVDREALDDVTLEGYWARFRIAELPEPLDAIVLQCFVALPADAAIRLMQSAAYITPATGVLDDDTMDQVLKMRSAGVEELLLHEQAGYYVGLAQRELCGMDLGAGLRRIDRCNEFLADWTMAHRVNVPLRAV
jgi:lysozyme family protein